MAEKQRHPLDIKSHPTRPTVRSGSLRKSGKDGTSWTPTEKLRRDRLLRQFGKRNKGYGCAISEEYRKGYDGIDWSVGASSDDLKNCGGKK